MVVTAAPKQKAQGPRLGESQIGCLRSLAEHRGGAWFAGCGWLWDTYSGTDRIMRSLARHGYAEIRTDDLPYGRKKTSFVLTPKGRERAIAEGAKPPKPRWKKITVTRDLDNPIPVPSQEDRFRTALEAIRDGHNNPRAVAREALDNTQAPRSIA